MDPFLKPLVDDELKRLANSSDESGPTSAAQVLSCPSSIASLIDHTLLAPAAQPSDVVAAAKEAKAMGCATVCVNASYVPQVAEVLRGSTVRPIAVVGFPLGAAATAAKVEEARWAVSQGAAEIDMVQHVGQLKAGNYGYVYQDMAAVVQASGAAPVKVIIETCLLTRDEIVASCVIAELAGAAFVKTSTGFSTGGAKASDVALMRAVALHHQERVRFLKAEAGPASVPALTNSKVQRPMRVKASGGVRTLADLRTMVEAGADRVGASGTAKILEEAKVASAAGGAPGAATAATDGTSPAQGEAAGGLY